MEVPLWKVTLSIEVPGAGGGGEKALGCVAGQAQQWQNRVVLYRRK